MKEVFLILSWLVFGIGADPETNSCSGTVLITNQECSNVQSVMNEQLDWARAGGAEISKIRINQTFEGSIRGRFLQSTIDLHPGEEILFIPDQLIISYKEAIKSCDICKLVSEEKWENTVSEKFNVLTVYLVSEMENPDSVWRPFLNIYPISDNFMPSTFIELARDELRNTSTLVLIEQHYAQALKGWENYSKFGYWPFKKYLWAYNMVNSRGFVLENIGYVLVPIADLLNASPLYNAEYRYDDIRKGFLLKAYIEIPNGGEINIAYGKPSNAIFFASFGFIQPGNRRQGTRVSLVLKPEYPDYKKKLESETKFFSNGPFSLKVPEVYDKNAKKVFGALRVFTQKMDYNPGRGFMFDMSVTLEEIMLIAFIENIDQTLLAIKGTTEEDLELLKGWNHDMTLDADTQRMQMMVSLRLEDRDVLRRWRTFATDCISILRGEVAPESANISSLYLDQVIQPLLLGQRAVL